MADTSDLSRQAYQDLKEAGKDLNQRDLFLLDLLREGPATRRELARRTTHADSFSSVTPRIRELLDRGLVKEDGTKTDPDTGKEGAVLKPTENAVPYLSGDHEPEVRASVKDLRQRVIRHARAFVHEHGDVWATTTAKADHLEKLEESVETLEDRDGRL